MKPRLLLLDRDGTVTIEREGFITQPHQLELIPKAAEAIALANHRGLRVALVTNQSVVGRGIITEEQLEEIHAHLHSLLGAQGAVLDAIYAATDHPDRPTPRRKPGSGMLREALNEFGVSASESVMVGDSLGDLMAAASLGMPRILVRTGKGEATLAKESLSAAEPFFIDTDLNAAVTRLFGD
ncbi:MAG: HAD-IIIA family hydrolase [Alphaproteobacteria bacterium]|nr:HAD-IIIA family hydrolase [Alphaproteobacteria bacterium]